MNKKSIKGVLFILAIFTSVTVINFISAGTSANNQTISSPAAATVVINEVYGGGGNAGAIYNADFVELYNTGATPFNLSGYSIQYASAASNSFNQLVALPADSIPAGGYYLVQLTAAGATGANLPTPNFVAPGTGVNLSGTTGNVLFINSITAQAATCPASSTTTDKVAYGTGTCFETAAAPATTSATSASRVPNGSDTDNNSVDFQAIAPTPGAVNGSGGGTPTPTTTPTPQGAAVPGVKINEVYGGGGNAGALYNQDFIELYNNSTSNVDISGYTLQYGAATSTTAFAVCTITATDTIIEPNTYFLIAAGPISTTVGVNLPAVNATCPTTFNLSGTAGKLALVNGTTPATGGSCPVSSSLVDFVGYGATANCSETAVAPAPADSSSSIQRTPVGTDTNNNSTDFTSGAPSPTAGSSTVAFDANCDFNGDGKTDYVVTRDISGGLNWFVSTNGTGAFNGTGFGATGDVPVPEDYDGDGKDDIAVWRPGASATFYILQSNGNVFRGVQFGTTGDDPKVVADYDGDNKADIAVYRKSASQNFFYFLRSTNGSLGGVPWGGGTTTRPNVGDYDGDGKADYCVQYDNGSGNGVFALQKSTGGNEFIPFGLITDQLAPGDYDGDGKSDFTVVRGQSGAFAWYTLTRTNNFSGVAFGALTDILTPGDYDGDGKTDVSVWRPNTGAGAGSFYSRSSVNGGLIGFGFGASTDYPAANWNVH